MTYLLIIVLLVVVVSAVVYWCYIDESWAIWCLYSATLCLVVGLLLSRPVFQGQIYSEFTKEVNMKEIPMEGVKKIRVQCEIVYKDGKLDAITLIPQTTSSSVYRP